MVAMAMTRRPLPWLKLRQWRVSEVDEVMDERCASNRIMARWRWSVSSTKHGGDDGGAAVLLGHSEGEREAEQGQ